MTLLCLHLPKEFQDTYNKKAVLIKVISSHRLLYLIKSILDFRQVSFITS